MICFDQLDTCMDQSDAYQYVNRLYVMEVCSAPCMHYGSNLFLQIHAVELNLMHIVIWFC